MVYSDPNLCKAPSALPRNVKPERVSKVSGPRMGDSCPLEERVLSLMKEKLGKVVFTFKGPLPLASNACHGYR